MKKKLDSNFEKEVREAQLFQNRRQFLSSLSIGIGSVALGALLIPDLFSGKPGSQEEFEKALPHFAPKAKRVIYLFQSGGVSQLESFDHKPRLREMMGQDLPASIRGNQRLTGMTAGQAKFPLVGSYFDFAQYGQSRAWVSSLFPYMAKVVDDLCIIRSMHTDAINHDPAITFFKPDLSKAVERVWGLVELWIRK
ncbi:DUF1501 domain-containing protein [Sphingobacterium sp. E70]|uniref:DUF1501 domain-containing protein n=1 Tax=Sphingobacterium sp. E70 TaxID=2853439 RepID=UPI00211C3571|nr:DUF1501 domain-containing protein [Sphingobacterium sp. E70]